MKRPYETMIIINPDVEENVIDKTITTIQDIITTGGGVILKVDTWGKRPLVYHIRKKRDGYYVIIYFEAPPALIIELQRRYKLIDTILRYLVIQLKKGQMEEMLNPSAPAKTLKSSAKFLHARYGEDGYDDDDDDVFITSKPEKELTVSAEE